MLPFLRANLRWLGAGFFLTLASSFGQTFFISLFASEIRAAHGLSIGGWGSLYTAATLGAAALLFLRGGLADTVQPGRLAPAVILLLAAATLGMALGGGLALLFLSVLFLRFAGQGMCGHLAMTAMGRWFAAHRGRAVAIAALGFSAGEALLPVPAVLLMDAIGWRETWALAAAILALAVAPLLAILFARSRQPAGAAADAGETAGIGGHHWTRAEALRHWLLPALIPIMLTPGFVGTVIFFHQAHVAEIKDWSLAAMAPGYSVYAGLTIAASLTTGWAVDRFGPARLLPLLLLPMAGGIATLGPAGTVFGWFAALALLGLTQGANNALWGAFLPAAYGTRHLGSVRALFQSLTVVSTAAGPGITGLLIDVGIPFPSQVYAIALWCLAMSGLGALIARRLGRGTLQPA